MNGFFNNGGGIIVVDCLIIWEGKSFEVLFYYGVKVMYWCDSGWGFGVEMIYVKVYVFDVDLMVFGLDCLEFIDGYNILIVNVSCCWDGCWWEGCLFLFVIGGFGVVILYVDV